MLNFAETLTAQDAVLLLGAGVSASASTSSTGWAGLLANGLARLRSLGATEDTILTAIEALLNSSSGSGLVFAASMVEEELNKVGDQAYAKWLADAVGSQEVESDELLKAILSLPLPIFTTNYDTLLEEVGQRKAVTWKDAEGIRAIARRETRDIGHLHGVWSDPDSVVLGTSSYGEVLRAAGAQSVLKSLATLKSIVYVGVGQTLEDPNFSSFMDWQRSSFPGSSVQHFRLCLESQVSELEAVHRNDPIRVVPFGQRFEDLPGFLFDIAKKLNKGGLNEVGLMNDTVTISRSRLLNSVADESIVGRVAGSEQRVLVEAIEPILIPVPYSSFVEQRLRQQDAGQIDRLEPAVLAKQSDLLVVAGDEGSGVTVAVKWLAHQLSLEIESAPPVYMRFSEVKSGRRAFLAALHRACESSGVVADSNSELPEIVLAIDDFEPNQSQRCERVINGLEANRPFALVIGCRTDSVDSVVSALRPLGDEVRVVYTGRLSDADTYQLAQMVDAETGSTLARKALKILDTEGLQRTPLNVSLLLVLLSQGYAYEHSSQTEILLAYTSLMLVAMDFESFNLNLSRTDLLAILSYIAGQMVLEQKSVASESDIMAWIEQALEKYGWQKTSPTTVLRLFKDARILEGRFSEVWFARSAFFFLFGAKFATIDVPFREKIFSDGFYYQPLLMRYAGLTPSDGAVLPVLRGLLKEALEIQYTATTPFDEVSVELPSAKRDYSDEDDLYSQGSDSNDLRDQSWYAPEMSSRVGFSVTRDNLDTTSKTLRFVEAISSCIRDLTQVTDLVLKTDLFVGALTLWGRWISMISVDQYLSELENALVIPDSSSESDFDKDSFDQWARRLLPSAIGLAAMEKTLSSPHLDRILNDSLRAGRLDLDIHTWVAALLLLAVRRQEKWISNLSFLLGKRKDNPWVVTIFLRVLCEMAYLQSPTRDDALRTLITEILQRTEERTPSVKQNIALYLDRLEKRRQAQAFRMG